jgi:hypothetical protein
MPATSAGAVCGVFSAAGTPAISATTEVVVNGWLLDELSTADTDLDGKIDGQELLENELHLISHF